MSTFPVVGTVLSNITNMSNSLAKQVLQRCFFMLAFFCSFTAHYYISLRNNAEKNCNTLLKYMYTCSYI